MSITLADARRELFRELETGALVTCPCCDGRAKIYWRRITSRTARSLIALNKARTSLDSRQREGQWLHLPAIIGENQADETKSRFWDVIEPRPGERDDGSTRTGWWRFQSAGLLYVQNRLALPEFAVTYQNKLLRLEGRSVTIKQALGQKFSYDELMSR